MNVGKDFENQWKASVPSDCFYLRINDPPQSFNQDSKNLRFSLQNPFDALMYSKGLLFCLEMKSTIGSLTYWKDEFDNNDKKQAFNLKKNQIKGLLKASESKGVIAGFILNFRKTEKTYFLSIHQFMEMINVLDKKSFNESDVKNMDAYLINQTLKRTKYTYDVADFIDEMAND